MLRTEIFLENELNRQNFLEKFLNSHFRVWAIGLSWAGIHLGKWHITVGWGLMVETPHGSLLPYTQGRQSSQCRMLGWLSDLRYFISYLHRYLEMLPMFHRWKTEVRRQRDHPKSWDSKLKGQDQRQISLSPEPLCCVGTTFLHET